MIAFLSPLLVLLVLAILSGALLGYAAQKFKVPPNRLVDRINTLLPQTQCAQCGYPGCKPYAAAIAAGAAINLCPPGGDATIIELAKLLDTAVLPLKLTGTEDKQPEPALSKKVARIREDECIGCTFCIQACPVDAIAGAAQQMHMVISKECTGCELCIAPCPVDCIDLLTLPQTTAKAMPAKSLSEQACIRCGLCVEVCPVNLLPQQLFWFAQGKAYDKAKQHRLMDCIECGLCHAVCPSHIPLVQYYQVAKSHIHEQDAAFQLAQYTKARFDNRELRLAEEEALAEQRRQQRAKLAAAKSRQEDLIHNALQRARAKQKPLRDTP